MRLQTLKPLHACWLLDFYNFITSAEGKDTILNGWKTAGIYDAIRLGLKNLPSINPFHDIEPLISEDTTPLATNLDAVCQLDQGVIDQYCAGRQPDESDDGGDEIWEPQQRCGFDVFDDFDDEHM